MCKTKMINNIKLKRILKLIKKIWMVCGIIFTISLFVSSQSKGFDKTLLQSSDVVTVLNDSNTIEFTPLNNLNTTALLFYPGAAVDPKAYVPLARKISENGYKVIIVKLPFRMAFLESQKNELFSRSKQLIQKDDAVNHWVVAGHSRGGALAAEFVKDENKLVDGLILIGTTHPKEFDLSNLDIDISKIFATNDGLASEQEIIDYAKNLPADTHWVKIEGGNHAQFGYYGFQLGDNKATISRTEQQRLLENSIIQVLQRVSK